MSETGACFNCDKTASDERFCYGCHAYVCDGCDVGWSVAEAKRGTHAKEDHLIEAETGEEDDELND